MTRHCGLGHRFHVLGILWLISGRTKCLSLTNFLRRGTFFYSSIVPMTIRLSRLGHHYPPPNQHQTVRYSIGCNLFQTSSVNSILFISPYCKTASSFVLLVPLSRLLEGRYINFPNE